MNKLNADQIAEIAGKLKAGELRAVEGGFSQAHRGIITLHDGMRVFAKQAVDDETKRWLLKEAEVYKFLAERQFLHIPELLAVSEDLLVLPDLSAWDFKPVWTAVKLQAILNAIDDLAKLETSPDAPFGSAIFAELDSRGWRNLIEASDWQNVLDKSQKFDGAAEFLDQITKEHRQGFAKTVKKPSLNGDKLVHGDVRADNFAYNHATGQVQMIDWNWAEIGNPDIDKTALMVSAIRENADQSNPIDLEPFTKYINIDAAIAIAGFWFTQSIRPPYTPGDPRGLRDFQFKSAMIALRLAV